MKKAGLYVGLGLVLVLVAAVFVLRTLAKSFVESDEFRAEFRAYLEQGASTVIPRAMADVKAIKLVGFATIEVLGIKIQSTKDLNATLSIPRVAVTPALTSLFGKGPARISGEGDVAGGGRFADALRIDIERDHRRVFVFQKAREVLSRTAVTADQHVFAGSHRLHCDIVQLHGAHHPFVGV